MSNIEEPLIVITGGAGFIGSALVRYLNDQGKENIIIVDDLGEGRSGRIWSARTSSTSLLQVIYSLGYEL